MRKIVKEFFSLRRVPILILVTVLVFLLAFPLFVRMPFIFGDLPTDNDWILFWSDMVSTIIVGVITVYAVLLTYKMTVDNEEKREKIRFMPLFRVVDAQPQKFDKSLFKFQNYPNVNDYNIVGTLSFAPLSRYANSFEKYHKTERMILLAQNTTENKVLSATISEYSIKSNGKEVSQTINMDSLNTVVDKNDIFIIDFDIWMPIGFFRGEEIKELDNFHRRVFVEFSIKFTSMLGYQYTQRVKVELYFIAKVTEKYQTKSFVVSQKYVENIGVPELL